MMAEQCCANCDAFLKNKDLQVKFGQPHQGWCRAKPPILIQTMMQVNSKFAPGGPQVAPAFQGVFPPTSSEVWCREWRPRTSKHQERLPPSEEIIDVTADDEPLTAA
jgi:hypothetical protein